MIALDGAAKRYAGNVALAPTNLTVKAQSCLALVGPSGCGKSTILRLVLGLVIADEGNVFVGKTRVGRTTARHIRRRTGYVIQDGGLFPHLSARNNATLVARHLGWGSSRVAARIADLGALLHLDAAALDRYPSELSGGQRQRVGIMRALMLDPEILLLDEPLGALDPMIRVALQRDLKRIFSDLGKTVILVTHDLREAEALSDQVALMRGGHIVQHGPMRELVDSPVEPFVRAFIEAQQGLTC